MTHPFHHQHLHTAGREMRVPTELQQSSQLPASAPTSTRSTSTARRARTKNAASPGGLVTLLSILVMLASPLRWGAHGIASAFLMRPLQGSRACQIRSSRLAMSTRTTDTKPPSAASNSAIPNVIGVLPSFSQLLTSGRALLRDSLRVAQEVGPRAGLARTLSATKAFSETARDLLVELRKYQQQQQQGEDTAVSPFTRATLAKSMRQLFERLGATYIKVGQFIASSPTLFPEEFVLEFQKCLDQSAPVPYSVVRETLRAELGGDKALNEKFEFIDPIPLASASIAQVHVARLRGTGEEVVLKVLKPGVTETLKADLGFIYLVSRLLETLAPDLARTSLGDIVADIRTSILEEVDFRKELTNLEEFRAFLAKSELTAVATCPRVFPALSTQRVLTMERLRGVSLIDLEGIKAYTDDPEGTLIAALNTWSLSVVLCPSFHADVHSGNLLVLEDGRVGFIDFGIVGRLSPETWQAVTEVGEGLVGGDYRVMAQGLIRMGATAAAVDEGKLAGDLQALFERLRTLDPQMVVIADVESQTAAASLQVDEEQVTRLLLEIVEVASSNGLKLPRQFGLLIKQSLYFDRYTRILAPTLDPLRDSRVNFPRTVEEAEKVSSGGRGRMGARRREREEDLGVVIDVTPKK